MSEYSLEAIVKEFIRLEGSDLYLTFGCAPNVRVADNIIALEGKPLADADIEYLLAEMLPEEKRQEFFSKMEFNAPIELAGLGRFRVNIFRQQQHTGIVMRRVRADIPTVESLKIPKIYSDIIMEARGLILVVGATGAGKSTSLAAMIGHRNQYGYGHILTVEDPIEFIHQHNGCMITQRDVGIDTYSYGDALKNALRQRPDVVLIGEIRDRETMEHALNFSETGHLCVATLHAGNTCQAIERVLNFFPEETRRQVSYNLAYNLLGIFSQRLVLTKQNTRTVACEIMLNRGFISTLIQENKVKEIPEVMLKNTNDGMQTFDQALYTLYKEGVISDDVAIAESDNPANIQLLIRKDKSSGMGKTTENSFLPKSNSNF